MQILHKAKRAKRGRKTFHECWPIQNIDLGNRKGSTKEGLDKKSNANLCMLWKFCLRDHSLLKTVLLLSMKNWELAVLYLSRLTIIFSQWMFTCFNKCWVDIRNMVIKIVSCACVLVMCKVRHKSILIVTPELRTDLWSENGSVCVSRLLKKKFLFYFILFYFSLFVKFYFILIYLIFFVAKT